MTRWSSQSVTTGVQSPGWSIRWLRRSFLLHTTSKSLIFGILQEKVLSIRWMVEAPLDFKFCWWNPDCVLPENLHTSPKGGYFSKTTHPSWNFSWASYMYVYLNVFGSRKSSPTTPPGNSNPSSGRNMNVFWNSTFWQKIPLNNMNWAMIRNDFTEIVLTVYVYRKLKTF